MARKVRERRWAAYMIAGKSAVRLGTIVAPDDLEAAVAHAIDYFGITDPHRQRRVAVRPIEEAAN